MAKRYRISSSVHRWGNHGVNTYVLVCETCYNKTPQTGELYETPSVFSQAGEQKSKWCHHGWCLFIDTSSWFIDATFLLFVYVPFLPCLHRETKPGPPSSSSGHQFCQIRIPSSLSYVALITSLHSLKIVTLGLGFLYELSLRHIKFHPKCRRRTDKYGINHISLMSFLYWYYSKVPLLFHNSQCFVH